MPQMGPMPWVLLLLSTYASLLTIACFITNTVESLDFNQAETFMLQW